MFCAREGRSKQLFINNWFIFLKINLLRARHTICHFFSVGPMSRAYRATIHPYKLLFQIKTRVEAVKSSEFSFSGISLVEGGSGVSMSGLSLIKCGEIAKYSTDYNYLVVEK